MRSMGGGGRRKLAVATDDSPGGHQSGGSPRCRRYRRRRRFSARPAKASTTGRGCSIRRSSGLPTVKPPGGTAASSTTRSGRSGCGGTMFSSMLPRMSGLPRIGKYERNTRKRSTARSGWPVGASNTSWRSKRWPISAECWNSTPLRPRPGKVSASGRSMGRGWTTAKRPRRRRLRGRRRPQPPRGFRAWRISATAWSETTPPSGTRHAGSSWRFATPTRPKPSTPSSAGRQARWPCWVSRR